jgi:uncharacterized protein (DUF486 family)
MQIVSPKLAPILLLLGSNVFMTFAWYGHLKFKDRALWIVILLSWGIAFFEYCLAVPANRIGSAAYSAAQLKAVQEVVTLSVFALFSVLYLGQRITVNHVIGFALIAAGAFFVFRSPVQIEDGARSYRSQKVTMQPPTTISAPPASTGGPGTWRKKA